MWMKLEAPWRSDTRWCEMCFWPFLCSVDAKALVSSQTSTQEEEFGPKLPPPSAALSESQTSFMSLTVKSLIGWYIQSSSHGQCVSLLSVNINDKRDVWVKWHQPVNTLWTRVTWWLIGCGDCMCCVVIVFVLSCTVRVGVTSRSEEEKHDKRSKEKKHKNKKQHKHKKDKKVVK